MIRTHFKTFNTFCLFLMLGLGMAMEVYGLPDRYQVIASEVMRDFTYYEDQPWAKPPPELHLSDQLGTGQVVIVHFWATSCPSCVPELKALEAFARTYVKQPVRVIAISLNDPRSGVLRNYFSTQRYRHLKPYHRASVTRPSIKGLPTTLFFNKSGELVGKIEGVAPWSSDEMHRLVQRLRDEVVKADDIDNITLIQKIMRWFGQ